MTRVTFRGPPPAEIIGVCLVCLMLAKGAELNDHAPEWINLRDDGKEGPAQVYVWKPGRYGELRAAVVEGISDVMPQAGLIPVCWDHLASIEVTIPSRILPSPQIPPGLLKGRG